MPDKSISRRSFLKGLAAAGGGAVLAACKPQVVKETVIVKETVEKVVTVAPTEAPEEMKTIVVWESGNKPFADKLTELSASIESETRIKMEFLPASGGWKGQLERINAAIAARVVPDLAHVKDFNMWDLAWREAVLPLGDFYATGELDTSDVRKPVLDSQSFRGVPYAVPHRGSFVWIMFINDEMFADVGLDPATDVPKTWDELIQVGHKLTDADTGTYGHAFYEMDTGEPALMIFSTYVGQAGGRIFSESLDAVTLDTPETNEALQWMQDAMYKEKVVLPADMMANEWDLVYNNFIATWHTGLWFRGQAEANAPQLKWSLHPVPCHKTCDNADTPECLVMPKGVRDPQLSWDAAVAITTPEFDEILSAQVGALPIFKGNLGKGQWATEPTFMEFAKIGAHPELRNRQWVIGYDEIVAAVLAEIEPVWYNQRSVKEGLAAAEKAGNEVIARTSK
jgi:multiple sugar transport system substrate-binding protein